MASSEAETEAATESLCDICLATPWFSLPQEFGGQAHHKSRRALESSATKCTLCAMVLRAAITHGESDDIKH